MLTVQQLKTLGIN